MLVKAVPDAARGIMPQSGRLDRSGEGGLSVADRYAIEAGLQLRESGAWAGARVTVLTMGPPTADRALRRALAMGCDRAVHLCDPALEGSDVIATGSALARLAAREEPGVVLLGEASADAGCGVMAGIVAEFLELPAVTAVRQLRVTDGALVAEQLTEFGRLEIRAAAPVVLAIAADANTPRYASLKETMLARERPVDRVTCADLGLALERVGVAGAAVQCEEWHDPQPRVAGTIIEPATAPEAVETIIAWLEREGLVGDGRAAHERPGLRGPGR